MRGPLLAPPCPCSATPATSLQRRTEAAPQRLSARTSDTSQDCVPGPHRTSMPGRGSGDLRSCISTARSSAPCHRGRCSRHWVAGSQLFSSTSSSCGIPMTAKQAHAPRLRLCGRWAPFAWGRSREAALHCRACRDRQRRRTAAASHLQGSCSNIDYTSGHLAEPQPYTTGQEKITA